MLVEESIGIKTKIPETSMMESVERDNNIDSGMESWNLDQSSLEESI